MDTKIKLVATFLFMFAVAPFALLAQTKKGLTITGHLDGLKNGDVIKLGNRFGDWHKLAWTDSCVILNGNFHLQVEEVSVGPQYYEIYFFEGLNGHTFGKTIDANLTRQNAHELRFAAENGDQIVISGNIQQWNSIKISGSRSNDASIWANSLVQYAYRSNLAINSRLRKIGDSIGYDRKLVEEQVNLKRQIDDYLNSAIRNSSSSYAIGTLYLITSLHDYFGGYHGYFQKELYSRLSLELQNSYLGKLAKNYAVLSIGQPFPSFILPINKGKMIALNDFIKKNKITLVHFWGTRSVDREIYQNQLKAVYDKFHLKGLDVIAVSADTSRDDWEFMVHQKKYPWTNVLAEPKGWGEGSLVNDVYGEGGHSIPNTTNVLLDNKGTILAWDVSGLELQYYLEKYLGN